MDPQASTGLARSRTGEDLARAILAGAIAAACAISASELIAGLLPGAPSLIVAIGQGVIDHQPPGAKDFVVALFGENDKLALEVFIVVVALVIAGGLGIAARWRFAWGALGFVAAGFIAFAAALQDPQVTALSAVVSAAVAAGVGIQVLAWLTGPPGRRSAIPDRGGAGVTVMPDWSRRGFLLRSGTFAAGALVAGVVGRSLLDRQRSGPIEAVAKLGPPSRLASLPAGAELQVPGITPLVMPNDRFYRIDTSLLVPTVDLASWRLRIHGRVEREVTLSYDELAALPMFEQYVTIACVSNLVGGNLVGNAKWTGVSLRDVLDMAGVQPGATQLVGRSVDGWTAGMPTAWVMDEHREPMIALEMNGQPLPLAHGFPARLIVPGLFGYVSATKWLSELELTTLEEFDGYWVPLGWAKVGPILTQSRIDVPRNGAGVAAGRVTVAGLAWAPDRGVRKVEVAIDGNWHAATLSTPIADTTWVQWRYDWDAAVGSHTIEVRATDGSGEVQTDQHSEPAPDGARGHHTISVNVG